MDERVERREQSGHVGRESRGIGCVRRCQPSAARARQAASSAPAPTTIRSAVPVMTPAQSVDPGGKQRVERLAPIAERADEADERAIVGESKREPRGGGPFVRCDRRKAFGVDAVVDDARPCGRRTPTCSMTSRARPPAVADDEAGVAERAPFGGEIAAPRQPRPWRAAPATRPPAVRRRRAGSGPSWRRPPGSCRR